MTTGRGTIGRFLMVLATTAIALAGVPAVAFAAPGADADDQKDTKVKPAPKAWDERVAPYVALVEGARGLKFDHPVPVKFLDDAAFEKALRTAEQSMTKEERARERQVAGELLALGLTAQEIDPRQAAEDLADYGVAGFYDSETEELFVRGNDTSDILVRTTIVHELTHALQDQHFDLDALHDDTKDASEEFALVALVEGDATAVQTAYLDSLPPDEQAAFRAAVGEVLAQPLPEGVPYALQTLSTAAYGIGAGYVEALDPEGGTAGRDQAFTQPPVSEELLVDPLALAQHQPPVAVPAPTLEKGEKKAYGPEPLGVVTIFAMLATRLDPRVALEAVTGWGGDQYVSFRRDGDVCIRANVTGDSPDDTAQLETALTAWSQALPTGAVAISRAADIVTFTACQTDGVTEPTDESWDRAFSGVLASRVFNFQDAVEAGFEPGAARCSADLVITDPQVFTILQAATDQNREPNPDELTVLQDVTTRAAEACGAF